MSAHNSKQDDLLARYYELDNDGRPASLVQCALRVDNEAGAVSVQAYREYSRKRADLRAVEDESMMDFIDLSLIHI